MAIRLSSSQSGQSLVELGALLALVSLTAILGLSMIGVNVGSVFDTVACQIAKALGDDEQCEEISNLLFHDSFDNLDAWYKEYGNWQLKDGQLCVNGSGRIFRPVEEDNYRIRIDQAMLTSGPGHGVFFRATNFDARTKVNGYTFQYDKVLKAFVIRKWINGNEVYDPPHVARAPAPDNYAWHNTNRQIELEVKGNTFTAYVDGVQVLSASDDTYSSGGIGFRTWNHTSESTTDACFDDVSVTALP
ncbi:DUF1080 domain-containing protein [Candidatus Chloroploca sp. M-50]|uniref:DUF1080 domain-containing protein n=1 Tax=Candidatus Chloroploca mongolica TaxID=2528176 RepID=A0ABS4DF10_9CHLR|nr:family 16 glycoside hydrolase [Candidatus Chloroploca mongolica]MBP1468018.1 DUF1080 domain-containing protein [Candidatus Chloroploca mongolica]